MKPYAVVVFDEHQEVEAIPSSWIKKMAIPVFFLRLKDRNCAKQFPIDSLQATTGPNSR